MKIKFWREFQIGILVIVTITILFFGVNYLKGINIFNPTNYFYAKFDRIDGLVATNAVTSRGYKIGLVKSIDYNYNNPEDGVVVVLQVDDQLKIPAGSKVVLKKELLGGASLELELKNNEHGLFLAKGDTIPSLIDDGIMAAVTEEIMPRVQNIIPQLDSLIYSLRLITEDKSIQHSLGSIQRMTANLESASFSINSMVKKDVPDILRNVNTLTSDFSQVSRNFSQIDFNKTMQSLDHTLNNLQMLSDKMNTGDGTIGLLLNDATLYKNLSNATRSADELLLDLKANPKRYVQFSLVGKSEKK